MAAQVKIDTRKQVCYTRSEQTVDLKTERIGAEADMAELADALDLGSSGQPCRFKSCYPQKNRWIGRSFPDLVSEKKRKAFRCLPFLTYIIHYPC